jgi:hypothetical protein
MNTILASFRGLLFIILGLSCAPFAFAVSVLQPTQLTNACDNARANIFIEGQGLSVGKTTVRLFSLKAGFASATPYIVVILKRGSDADAEIPLFDKICLSDNTMSATFDATTGNLFFKSEMDEIINIIFRRHDTDLKHSKWKADPQNPLSAPDSVWMVSYTPKPNSPAPKPISSDWCKNVPKQVNLSADKRDVSFAMCPFDPSLAYAYALHLNQTGNEKIPVDIGIDPQIIHQPH